MKRNSKKKELSQKSIKPIIRQELESIKPRLSRHFSRSETKDSAVAYFRGLISMAERKNSWQLSEEIGYSNPYAFQYLIGRALWDSDCLYGTRSEKIFYLFFIIGKKNNVTFF